MSTAHATNGLPPGTTRIDARSITELGTEMRSYYGRPVLKEPVWKHEIPAYFFTGGLAGGSAVLGLAARAAGNHRLARTALYVATAGDVASPVLLVADLGRPERFLNMFRMLKPTSPMSVGSWILGTSGATTTLAALLQLTGRAPRTRVVIEALSALAGFPLATYTAVLVSDTAIPVWHEARRELPFVFAASSLATSGAAATALLPPREAGPARRLATGAALAETIASVVMRRRLGFLGEPYSKGRAGLLARTARACSLAGAGLLGLVGARSRAAAVAGGALVLGGGLGLRLAVYEAGKQSAADPRYTVEPQRRRVEERRGAPV